MDNEWLASPSFTENGFGQELFETNLIRIRIDSLKRIILEIKSAPNRAILTMKKTFFINFFIQIY